MTSGSSPRKRSAWLDPTLLSLLAVNLWIFVLYLSENWSAAMILWIYWCQSVLIGIFSFLRLLTLKNFHPDGITSGGSPVPPTRKAQRALAGFFLLHYGFFHLVYAVFLVSLGTEQSGGRYFNAGAILRTAAALAANHAFSFFYNLKRDRERHLNAGVLMFLPYARIFPMHLCIMIGALLGSTAMLVVFILLKTGADLLMHTLEHRFLERGGEPA